MKKFKKIKTTIGIISIMSISALTTHVFSLQESENKLLNNIYYSEIDGEPTIITIFEKSEYRSANIQYMTVDNNCICYKWDKNLPEKITPISEVLTEDKIKVKNKEDLHKKLIQVLNNN